MTQFHGIAITPPTEHDWFMSTGDKKKIITNGVGVEDFVGTFSTRTATFVHIYDCAIKAAACCMSYSHVFAINI